MSHDVRDLAGMRGAPGLVMIGVFAVVCLALAALTSQHATNPWPMYGAALVLAAAAYFQVTSAGDPMPIPMAVGVGAAGAVACGLGLWKLKVPVADTIAQWPVGMVLLLFIFMCVRGRVLLAWLGFLGTVGACTLWSAWTGQGVVHGVTMSFLNIGPILMASLFAYTVRPLDKAIYELRDRSTQRAASEAAAAAVLEARDTHLDELDRLARPLLERIGTGVPLDDDERMACQLLEARLRDTLRAPGLGRADVVAAAMAARRRGVTVVMLDDRGMEAASADLHAIVADQVTAELDAVANGTVTVRILPPRRKTMATILVSGDQSRRVEFDRSGARLVKDEREQAAEPASSAG